MKSVMLGLMAAAVVFSSAEAKGGRGTTPIPPAYDYTREKAKDYKRDYCEDVIGNHIYCPGYTPPDVEAWNSWHS